uniref:C1q domain-containing protein n=1 Tax=Pinctada fucata TaxID=50426 RepID=A0A194ANM1_PINFU
MKMTYHRLLTILSFLYLLVTTSVAEVSQTGSCSCGEKIAFYIRLSKDVQLAAYQTVIFDKVVTNIGNGYNNGTGIFISPASGLYQISGSVIAVEGYQDLGFDLMHNGNMVGNLFGHHTDSVVIYLELNEGDRVWIRKDFDTKTETMRGTWSSFSGHLIR